MLEVISYVPFHQKREIKEDAKFKARKNLRRYLSEAVIKTNIYSKYLQHSIHFVCLCSNQSIVKIMASIVEDVKSDLSSLLDALMTP